MPLLRAAALVALLTLAACASAPKNAPPDYQSRYNHCMNVAWGSGIDWTTRKAMCRSQALGLGEPDAADGKSKNKKSKADAPSS